MIRGLIEGMIEPVQSYLHWYISRSMRWHKAGYLISAHVRRMDARYSAYPAHNIGRVHKAQVRAVHDQDTSTLFRTCQRVQSLNFRRLRKPERLHVNSGIESVDRELEI